MAGRMRYSCPYCGRRFKYAASLQRHLVAGTRRGWCVADPAAALAAHREQRQNRQ